MNLQKETKIRLELKEENVGLVGALEAAKAENEKVLEKHGEVEVELQKETRLAQKLQAELDGWKEEANIYHNKLSGIYFLKVRS